MKKLILIGAAMLCVAMQSWAGDLFVIGNRDSLITADRGDLITFMQLNARHLKAAVRTLYYQLQAQGRLFNVQPGTVVNVVYYYNDGTAKIVWGDGEYRGFIAKADLTGYVGGSHGATTGIWSNDDE